MRTSTAGSWTALPDWAAPSPRPSRARLRLPLAPESRRRAMLRWPRPALPAFRCEEPTVPPVTSCRSRLRTGGPLSLPLGRLARPAAAMAALTLSAGGTAIAINAATTSTPHARPQISTPNAPIIAGQSNRTGDALRARIAAVTAELHALARTAPPAHHISHPTTNPRRDHARRHPRVSAKQHLTAGSEQSTAAQTTTATTPAAQTQSYTPPTTSAASSTSQSTAGSQTQATSSSQPAFGADGTLGPGRGAPGTQ